MDEHEDVGDMKSAISNSLFLNNLEHWIDDIISQDGLAEKDLIRTIKEKFERSLQANIQHHQFMMKSATENDDQIRADRHKLIANVYQALLAT
jgi:hypothetical protein